MKERALTFGPDGILVGILTEPDPASAVPGTPGHVILNSGILHRVGASRIYVQIARALAERGFTTLRFDFSGVGDSGTRRDTLPIEERFVRETQEAMDYLAGVKGVDRFVLGGLCSGADGAFWTALEDERVVGLWQIDPFTYSTLGSHLRHYGPKLLDPRAWLHSIRVRLPSIKRDDQGDSEVFVASEYRRVFPPRSVVREGLDKLLARDASLYLFLTGDAGVNYERQYADAFPALRSSKRLDVRFVPEAAHIVTGLEHQRLLLEDLGRWMSGLWGKLAEIPVGAADAP